MTNYPSVEFRRGAVEPVECLKAAWELIKDQYWLFFGLVLVGMLIAGAVPLGILMGPMMCGIFLTYFRKRKGLPIEFGTMFKGFDYFGQSIIAALLHVIPLTAVIFCAYIFLYVGMIASMFAGAAAGNDAAGPVMGLSFVLLIFLFYIIVLLAVILISIGFTFAYPLIVDRNMSGFDAVKLSFRAAFANFWRLFGLNLLGGLLGLVGVCLCFVGVYLVLPITLGASAIAYEQVFGLAPEREPNLPPPPPSF